MNKLGIDGAILISAFAMYRYDASYAVEAYKANPDQFALVKPLDVDDPAVDDVRCLRKGVSLVADGAGAALSTAAITRTASTQSTGVSAIAWSDLSLH